MIFVQNISPGAHSHSVLTHSSVFGCLLYHKETKEYQMGFHMYFNC